MTESQCPKCASPIAGETNTCGQCGYSFQQENFSILETDAVHTEEPDICAIGDVINDRYEVLSLIGRGGMGAVYKVHDKVLDEDLALKILLPHFVADKTVVERFINEVRITRKISHPNIVRVHDIGSMGDGMFISMEYVDGQSLRDILDRREPYARLSPRQAVYIISQLCIALKYAHRYTIHRDIKPDNIIVTQNNHIKLMDFGISKLKDERFDSNADAVVGTPYYMAPEQLHHAPDVDARADIYSMGVVLYELIAGKLPTGIPRPVSYAFDDVPFELDNIILKCLEPDREKRYQDPSELREALRLVAESFHDGSAPGITSSPGSSSDAGPTTVGPANLASAVEAFLKDEQERGSEGQGRSDSQTTDHRATAASSGDERTAQPISYSSGPTAGDIMDSPSRTYTPPRPYAYAEEGGGGHFAKIMIGLCIVAGALALTYFTVFRGGDKSVLPAFYEQEGLDGEIILERIQEMMHTSGDLVSILEQSIARFEQNSSQENREILNAVRQLLIQDVENRIFSRPFDVRKMNSASNDAVQVSQIDRDLRIRAMAEMVNREVAQFKFVLMSVDLDEETALFRLNNAYSSVEVESVQEGDLLQGRFLVTRVGNRAVFLEDTHPKVAGRQLTARLLEPVGAE